MPRSGTSRQSACAGALGRSACLAPTSEFVEGDNLGALDRHSRQPNAFDDESEHVGLRRIQTARRTTRPGVVKRRPGHPPLPPIGPTDARRPTTARAAVRLGLHAGCCTMRRYSFVLSCSFAHDRIVL